jgi:hypothetical protein
MEMISESKTTIVYACPMSVLCRCNADNRFWVTKSLLRLYFAGTHHSSSHPLLIMHARAGVLGVGGFKCCSGTDSKDS